MTVRVPNVAKISYLILSIFDKKKYVSLTAVLSSKESIGTASVQAQNMG